MARMEMTLSAKSRIGDFEQPVIDRAVRLMAGSAILHRRRMLPKKRPASLSMAHETGFINAWLNELRRIRSSVRVVAVRTGHLSFPERHVRGAHKLAFSLEVALTANFNLRPLVEKGSLVIDLGKLKAVTGFLHNRVTVDASESTTSMRACLPVSLDSFLMALEAGFVLRLDRRWGIFAECDEPADPLSSPFSHVLAARTVAALTCLLLKIVAGIEEEDLAHPRLREFLELRRVTGFADLSAYVGGLCHRGGFCGPNRMGKENQEEPH